MFLIESPVHTALRQASLRIAKRLEAEQSRIKRPDLLVRQIALIQQTFKTMTSVPYGVEHNVHIDAIGLGREVYRLFEAVQLCGEWCFDPKPEITEAVVMKAFNLVGTPNGVNTPIFPVGNVSPAARRRILQDAFFRGTPDVPWAAYCAWTGEDEDRKAYIKVENEIVGYPDGVFPLKLPPGVAYLDGILRTFDVN